MSGPPRSSPGVVEVAVKVSDENTGFGHAERRPPAVTERRAGHTPRPRSVIGADVATLLLANAVPLLGVIIWGWDIRSILVIYWCESGVIGFYNALKMLRIGGVRAIGPLIFFTIHYGIFMMAHLVFILVLGQRGQIGHLTQSPAELAAETFGWEVWVAVAALMVSHGVSYLVNFIGGREFDPERQWRAIERAGGAAVMDQWAAELDQRPGERERALRIIGVMRQMFAPYSRIVLMHVTIIFGAMPMILLGWTAWPLLAMLIIGKTAMDLRAHDRSHRPEARGEARDAIITTAQGPI